MASKKLRKKIKATNTPTKPVVTKNGSISVEYVKLSSQYAAPTTTINKGDAYVKYGEYNLFPYYLVELFTNSGLHRAIIERKVNMLLGNGADYKDNPTEGFIMANPQEDLLTVMEKCAYDLETFGGYYLQIIWENGGDKVASYYHMPYERMRVGLPNELGFASKYYYWTKDDEKIQQWTDINEFKEFEPFNLENKKKAQILFTKKYSLGNKHYGAPNYEGSLLDIQTYMEISNFHNSNLHNGFAPGYSIFFRGPEPTPEQKGDIVKQLKNKYSGSENTGKPMVFFLDSEQEAPIVNAIEVSDLDKQFEQLSKSIKENIVISHGVPRQVIGLESAGSLGNSKEILEAGMMFRTDYIIPEQNILLKGFNMISSLNGEEEITITNPNPSILLFGMSDLLKVLKQNEIRDYLGYEETDEIIEVIEVKEEEDDK